MKIAAIATAQVPSSTANSIQVMKVCQALARLRHSPCLLVPEQEEPLPVWEELAEFYGLTERFEVERLPLNQRLKRNDFAWRAARRARARGVDLVYTWAIQSAVFALLDGLPVLYEAHDLPTGRLGPLWLRAFLTLRGKKRLALITRALQLALKRRYGQLLPADQMVIAPNGLDLELYRGLPAPSKARRRLKLEDQLTVGCTGHLYAGRGVELFLGLAERFRGGAGCRCSRLPCPGRDRGIGQRHLHRFHSQRAPATLPGGCRYFADALREGHRGEQRGQLGGHLQSDEALRLSRRGPGHPDQQPAGVPRSN
jgi:hypothetical protein